MKLSAACRRLQCPRRCSTNSDNSAPSRLAFLNCCDGIRADRGPFGMHDMLARVIRLHRLEGTQPDMERYSSHVNLAFAQPVEDRGCEMQSRCRRRDRAISLCIDRWVALAVRFSGLALADVRRQRDAAMLREQFSRRSGSIRFRQPVPRQSPTENQPQWAGFNQNRLTDFRLAAR